MSTNKAGKRRSSQKISLPLVIIAAVLSSVTGYAAEPSVMQLMLGPVKTDSEIL